MNKPMQQLKMSDAMTKKAVKADKKRKSAKPVKVKVKAERQKEPPASDSPVHVPTDGPSAIQTLQDVTVRFSELTSGHRKRVHAALADVYAVAKFFEQDEGAWQDFCRHPSWAKFKGKKPQIDDRSEVLQPCVRFSTGFDQKDVKTVSKYHSALSVPYAEGVPPSEVAAYLDREGGIEELARKAAKRRREDTVSPADSSVVRITVPRSDVTDQLFGLPAGTHVQANLTIVGSDVHGNVEAKIQRIKRKGRDEPESGNLDLLSFV